MDKVEKFISYFHRGENDEITQVFTDGCCFWFAHILHTRFGGRIMYDYSVGHFVAEINGKLYDITGDVTGKYNCIDFENIADAAWKKRLIDCCINFEFENSRSRLQAKVPDVGRRTLCTYATLLTVLTELPKLAA